MAMPASIAAAEEQKLYPVHEEDNVPETSPHESAVRYARDVLEVRFKDSLVTGNICIYWIRGNRRRYVAADVMVALGRPREPQPRVYLMWREPPVSFVLEIGSNRTRKIDLEEKPGIYARQIRAEEYFYADPADPRSPRREMYLWRLEGQDYVSVPPEPNGRFRSSVLGVEFGYDDAGAFRIYADGAPQPTHKELDQQHQVAETRATAAETRATAEVGLRREAEARATTEADLRREAEARASDLERQLAELRARLPAEPE